MFSHGMIPQFCKVLGVGEKEFMEAMGVYFVEFVGQYGYDTIMTVLGRYLRDFLNGMTCS